MQDPIEHLAKTLNTRPSQHLDNVWRIVSALQAHWREETVLEPEKVRSLVGELTCYTLQMPIPIPLNEKRILARAVRVEPKVGIGYSEVSRLSYIPIEGKKVPAIGRMNRVGQSMFYACLGADANSMGAILSEARACPGEVFNILFSEAVSVEQKLHPYDDALHVTPIGMFDYIRRGVPHPFRLHDEYVNTYNSLRAAICVEGMLALQLTDAFITEALKHKETGQLYSITSEIAADCLTPEVVDGVIYPSTQFDGFPDVAIKPSSVDRKLKHHSVVSIKVLGSYGFGIFKTQAIGQGLIQGEQILWTSIE
jgi:hypothetical protein